LWARSSVVCNPQAKKEEAIRYFTRVTAVAAALLLPVSGFAAQRAGAGGGGGGGSARSAFKRSEI